MTIHIAFTISHRRHVYYKHTEKTPKYKIKKMLIHTHEIGTFSAPRGARDSHAVSKTSTEQATSAPANMPRSATKQQTVKSE